MSTSQGLAATAGPRVLPEGLEIGERYRVIKLLGRGGMGEVYLVLDAGLDRQVALKVIRAEVAENPAALERFKREIELSSRVTNRNVLRVYDLGEAEGVRFVTMQYVEGEDLAARIKREGRLPLPQILSIFRQICQGLAAAHEQNVMHRDLKPQNIMLDGAGGVYLTDFGLAKSIGQSGMTDTGVLLGTPYYMSPEQVKGETVDHRSDIYSLGIILYEMATGQVPYREGSAFEIMMQRLHRQPRPVVELNPDVPPYLRRILDRCLTVDPATRYQTVQEILQDLEAGVAGVARPASAPLLPRQRWLMAAGAVALVAVVFAAGWWLRTTQRPGEAKPQPTRSVLIADFQNLTGDPVFDGTVESALGVALEGAPFITSYRRDAARRLAAQLQPGATRIDEALARLIAGREGIDVITTGDVRPEGSGYSMTMRAIDALTGKTLATEEAKVSGKAEVLGTVTRLAARIRKALGDTTPESAQIAAAETYTAASLEAAHEYVVGMDQQFAGKWDEAIAAYQKALQLDPNLGRAYAGMGVIENNRGRHREADKYFQEAMAHVGRMSEREKYRTRGAYYLIVNRDPDKAIEQLGALVKQYPADNAGLANLAVAYQLKRDFPKALEYARRAVRIYPKIVQQRSNVGLFAMFAGDFETAIHEQQAALEINPRFSVALIHLALAQLAAGQGDAAVETWKRLEAIDASAAAEGQADLALYEGRAADARAILEKAAEADLAGKDADPAARKLAMLAEVDLLKGQLPRAAASAERAKAASSVDMVVYSVARILAAAGEEKRALALATDLDQRLAPEPQMYAELARGEVELRRRSLKEAITHFRNAGKLADSWLVRLDLGRAYLEAGAFTEAHAELDQCLKRRGEATDVFLEDVPTYRFFPPAHYYLGRALEGLKSPDAAAAYKAFLDIKAKADPGDPLVENARKRLVGAPGK